MSRSCWALDVQANAERLCEYLQTERPVHSVGSPKCRQAFMDLQSMDRRDPKFSKTLEARLSHLKSLLSRKKVASGAPVQSAAEQLAVVGLPQGDSALFPLSDQRRVGVRLSLWFSSAVAMSVFTGY